MSYRGRANQRSTVLSRDTDYSQRALLRRGNAVLGPHEREKALELIFPNEVSRFFLFDGELLQEYEELLITRARQGTGSPRQLRESWAFLS